MRQETKLLKEHLKKEFPNDTFSIRLVEPRNQLDSLNIIKIKTTVSYDDMYNCLKNITKGVIIYPKGKTLSITAFTSYNVSICGFTDTLVDCIEIESIKN